MRHKILVYRFHMYQFPWKPEKVNHMICYHSCIMCVAIKLLLLLIIVVIVMFLCTVPHSECANKQMYKYSIIETGKNSRHNSDVIMGKMASQITSLKIVYIISLKIWQFNDIINVYGFPTNNISLANHPASYEDSAVINCKCVISEHIPESKVHGANMGPIWGRQDPGGPHVAPWTLLSGMLRIQFMGTFREIALKWISQKAFCIKSILVQVMACCRQATTRCLSQCWPISMSPFG